METLNQQIELIKSFNNSGIESVEATPFGGHLVKFISTHVVAVAIQRELGRDIETQGANEYFFVSMLPLTK